MFLETIQSSLRSVFTTGNHHSLVQINIWCLMLRSAESTSAVLQHKGKLVWEVPVMPNPLAPLWLSINFRATPRKTALHKKVLVQHQHLPRRQSRWKRCDAFIKANLPPALSVTPFPRRLPKPRLLLSSPYPNLVHTPVGYFTASMPQTERGQTDRQQNKIKWTQSQVPKWQLSQFPNYTQIRHWQEGLKTGKLNPCAAHESVGNKRDNVS